MYCRLTNSPHYAAFKDTVSLLVSDWNDWLVKHPYIVASQLLVCLSGVLKYPPAPVSLTVIVAVASAAQIGSILFLAWLQLRFPTQPTAAGASKSRRLNPTPNIAATVENTTMQAPAVQLEPPKDTPFTVEELKEYDGAHDGKGIYVAIKGTIFDGEQRSDEGQQQQHHRERCFTELGMI